MISLLAYYNSGVEQFIGRFPEHVNMIKMDDGHTALHIAAANDHLDIVSLLCSLVQCNFVHRQGYCCHSRLNPIQICSYTYHCEHIIISGWAAN